MRSVTAIEFDGLVIIIIVIAIIAVTIIIIIIILISIIIRIGTLGVGRCTTRRQGTWAVPATCPMETPFREKSFQKASVLSAQAAGSDSPPGPRSKKHLKFLVFLLERGPRGESLPAAWALKTEGF